MSHTTADLEYFKCDVCGVYLHKDIFCDHRRECKGLHSTELKKQECQAIGADLSLETRRRVAALQQQRQEEGAAVCSSAPAPVATGATAGAAAVPLRRSIAETEKQQDARVRREVANAYQRKLDAEFEAKLMNRTSRRRC
ncbi:hypothetical protein STCU_03815 [Strigomonas culicis]|uniref:Uncharacterized protein n=1 Tax=Strigomonas culicis TaxID=28005 RepID=S9UPS0_9TRYP|nr:hypothetical protein STCU_03815 [Strigomonas culicis]|eukprot:EPY30888.1 hypothetical protein STCU_03815 [Strigomonas culicis]